MSGNARIVLLLAVAGILWSPSGLHAQACQGLPQGSQGGFAFGLTFPEDARSYGISGMGATEEGHLYLGASFSLTSYDQGDLEHEKSAGGVIAHEVSSVAPGLSLCPTVGAVYSWVEDASSWSIPFGVGLGKTLRLEGGETALTPYVIPQFIRTEVSFNDLSESDWFFGLSAGATFSFTHFFVGGFLSKIFEEDVDAVFGVQVGLAWK